MILSKYRIIDILEDIDERFAEEALDIPQQRENEIYSFRSSRKSVILRTAAKIGGFGAAAAVAITGVLTVKNNMNNVQPPLNSTKTAVVSDNTDGLQSGQRTDYQEIKQNRQKYGSELSSLNIGGLDFSEVILLDFPSSAGGKTLYFKKDLPQNGEKLFKSVVENFDPQFMQNAEGDEQSNYSSSYYNKDTGTVAQVFHTGFFSYTASNDTNKNLTNPVKSYFINEIGRNETNEKYLVGGKELTVNEMALLAEESANKCVEAVNELGQFKTARIRVYQKGGDYSFAADFSLKIDEATFFRLYRQKRQQSEFRLIRDQKLRCF